MYNIEDYDCELREDLIAQAPADSRDQSRLLHVNRVNGKLKDYSFYDLADLLQPGDLICTGSPGGSAIEFDPPRYLQPGDLLQVEISGIGTLSNPVEAE